MMVAMYVTCVKPLSSNPQLGVRADRTGRSGRGIVLLYLRLTNHQAKVLQWPLANCGCHPRSQHFVKPWSPSRGGPQGKLAANDLLAVSPVPPLPLRKGSANTFPCCNSSRCSLTVPQLLGPNNQWDDPRTIMANNCKRTTSTLCSLPWRGKQTHSISDTRLVRPRAHRRINLCFLG